MTLNDLTPTTWSTVAVRVQGDKYDAWDWHLDEPERDVLILAREGGTVITVQKRVDGQMLLWAKLAKVAGHRAEVVRR